MKAITRVGATIVLLAAWSALVLAGALFGWWRRPLASSDDPRAFLQAVVPLIEAGNRANTALILIDDGAVGAEYFSTAADPVDRNTVFATASLSKWIAAQAVMTLVQQGKLDLDRPVADYLTRWRFPGDSLASRQVTARRLLSHTAGLTDGLGFGDYRTDEALPSLEEVLAAPRASGGRPAAPIASGIEPGSAFRYSGGGYVLLELLVEELSGVPFELHVQREILEPLGMDRSGYADLTAIANAAGSYDAEGHRTPVFRHASRAATGFTTSSGDLVKLVLAQFRGGDAGPLAATTLEAMRKTEATSMGVALWGLGTVLYAPTRTGGVVFGHDGINDPATSATVRIEPESRDAIIVLATGSKSLASRLGAEWVVWQTGLPDVLSLPAEVRRVMPVLGVGAAAIVLAALAAAWRARRRQTRPAE